MEFAARRFESLMAEVESICSTSAAGYSLMRGWILSQAAGYEAAGFAKDVALSKAVANYRD